MIGVEWIEVPGGEFTTGLTARQKSEIAQRLYQGYGIDRQDPERRA